VQIQLVQRLDDTWSRGTDAGRMAEHIHNSRDFGLRHLGASEQGADQSHPFGEKRLDGADDVDVPLPEGVRLAVPDTKPSEKWPWQLTEPGVRCRSRRPPWRHRGDGGVDRRTSRRRQFCRRQPPQLRRVPGRPARTSRRIGQEPETYLCQGRRPLG
jgi:hypothetical protein